MTIKPISCKSNVVVQDSENEVLIYDLNTNKAYCLNQTSALVYQLADGTKTISEISEAMSIKLNILVSEDLVRLALDGLRKDNLLENADEVPNHFIGLSRREVIRKIGLGSMIALPMISSIVAPNAINAASCVAPGGIFVSTQPNVDACFGNPIGSPSPGSSGCCSGGLAGGSFSSGTGTCTITCS